MEVQDQADGIGQFELAGFWIRLIAAGADSIVAFIIAALGGFVTALLPIDRVLQILLGYVPVALYFALLWSDEGGGRTLGMRFLGLRVVRPDGRPLSLNRAFVRFGALLLTVVIPLLMWATLVSAGENLWTMERLREELARSEIPMLSRLAHEASLSLGGRILFALGWFMFVVLLPVLSLVQIATDKRKQGPHDQLADSLVVRKWRSR